MSEHFIKNIEIKNFKCFEDFKAEGFGRVNLIGGKNNVGKTAFMEAVYVNIASETVQESIDSITRISFLRWILEYVSYPLSRDEFQILLDKIKIYESNSNQNNVKFKILHQNGVKEYYSKINNKVYTTNANEFNFNLNITFLNQKIFIPQQGFINGQLKQIFESVQLQDKENILYEYLNEFDNNIENFKIIGGIYPQCKRADGNYQILNEFGDGLKHYISIICSLYACNDGYLFIDEIDNGIHYTQLDKLWSIILTLSKQQNVQVFATTHSKECIESYARVAKKLEDEEITFIDLGKNKKNEIKAIVMNSERFQREIEMRNEVRGW